MKNIIYRFIMGVFVWVAENVEDFSNEEDENIAVVVVD